MFNLGPLEVIAILVVALVVFGPSRLPEIGKQVGKAIREVKKFQNSIQSEVNDVFDVKKATQGTNGSNIDPTTNTIRVPENPLFPTGEQAASAMAGQESLFKEGKSDAPATAATPAEPAAPASPEPAAPSASESAAPAAAEAAAPEAAAPEATPPTPPAAPGDPKTDSWWDAVVAAEPETSSAPDETKPR